MAWSHTLLQIGVEINRSTLIRPNLNVQQARASGPHLRGRLLQKPGFYTPVKELNLSDKIIVMASPLNKTQLEILNLFRQEQSEEDLKEIKSLLVTYLADKVTRTADKAIDEKGYTAAIFQKWKNEHFRKSA